MSGYGLDLSSQLRAYADGQIVSTDRAQRVIEALNGAGLELTYVTAMPGRYVVRVEWRDKPEPLFRMSCYGVSAVRQWLDTDGWTAGKLRVKALEMVCEALRVDYVDCPDNIDVYFDQAAVERLTRGAS